MILFILGWAFIITGLLFQFAYNRPATGAGCHFTALALFIIHSAIHYL